MAPKNVDSSHWNTCLVSMCEFSISMCFSFQKKKSDDDFHHENQQA